MSHDCDESYTLAPGYLKSYAMKDPDLEERVDIDIKEFCNKCNSKKDVINYLLTEKPNIVGFSCYCWNIENVQKIVENLEKVMPETTVVLGGPEVGPIADEVLREIKGADIVVRGEGERTFSELLRHYALEERNLGDIEGITYRTEQGIKKTPEREIIEDLNEVPSPYLNGDIKPEVNDPTETEVRRKFLVEYSRGCLYNCSYCSWGNHPLRKFSKERTQKEIEFLVEELDAKIIWILTSCINMSQEIFDEIIEIIQSFEEDVAFNIHIRPDSLSFDMIDKLRDIEVDMRFDAGLQTINEKAMENINRRNKLKELPEKLERLDGENIDITLDLMHGIPDDNFFLFMNSLKFAVNLPVDYVRSFRLNILPGTELWERTDELEITCEKDIGSSRVLSSRGFPSHEIEKAGVFSKNIINEHELGKIKTKESSKF